MIKRMRKQVVSNDGGHSPDGWTGEFCALCSRNQERRVRWPCPAVERVSRS
jgi:hypothetical protein